MNQRNWPIAIDVCKSLHQPGHLTPDTHNWINYNINTRGNKSLLCYPKVKTEMFRKFLRYQRAAIFNKLPRELREELISLSRWLHFRFVICLDLQLLVLKKSHPVLKNKVHISGFSVSRIFNSGVVALKEQHENFDQTVKVLKIISS